MDTTSDRAVERDVELVVAAARRGGPGAEVDDALTRFAAALERTQHYMISQVEACGLGGDEGAERDLAERTGVLAAFTRAVATARS